jgi:uncharacterized membrane protein
MPADVFEDGKPMRRLASIDVLRALAILLMVQVHFVENLSPRDTSAAVLYGLSMALGLLPAPLFSFLKESCGG